MLQGAAGSLLLLFVAMVAEVFPGAPPYNTSMAAALAYFHCVHTVKGDAVAVMETGQSIDYSEAGDVEMRSLDEHKADEPPSPSASVAASPKYSSGFTTQGSLLVKRNPSQMAWWFLIGLTLCSVAADVHFATSVRTLVGLDEVKKHDNFKHCRVLAILLTLGCACLKLHLVRKAAGKFTHGRKVTRILSAKIVLFLPAFVLPTHEAHPKLALAAATAGRLLALTWIHLACGAVLFLTSVVAGVLYGHYAEFTSTAHVDLSLMDIMFVKSFSIIIVFYILFRQVTVHSMLSTFGCVDCHDLCSHGHRRHAIRQLSRRRRLQRQAAGVQLSESTLRTYMAGKALDAFVSLWMWIILADQMGRFRSDSAVGPKVVFRVVLATSIVCDVLAVVLSFTAVWFLTSLVYYQESSDDEGSGSQSDSSSSGPDSTEHEQRTPSPGRKLLVPSPLIWRNRTFRDWRRDQRRPRGGDNPSTPLSAAESSSEESEDEYGPRGAVPVDEYGDGFDEFMCEVDVNDFSSPTPHRQQKPSWDYDEARPQQPNLDTPGQYQYQDNAQPLTSREQVRAQLGQQQLSCSAHHIGGYAPDGLAAFAMTPAQFQTAWSTVGPSPGAERTLRTDVGLIPDADSIVHHLKARGFVVIASSTTPVLTKIYACARSLAKPAQASALFLLELVFSVEPPSYNGALKMTFKCDHASLLSLFVERLHLRQLIDGA